MKNKSTMTSGAAVPGPVRRSAALPVAAPAAAIAAVVVAGLTAALCPAPAAAQTAPFQPNWGLVNDVFAAAVAQQHRATQRLPTAPLAPLPFAAPPQPAGRVPAIVAAPAVPPAQSAPAFKRAPYYSPVARVVAPAAAEAAEPDDGDGVWRLEFGNEDRGIIRPIAEPVFDPIFGGSPTDGGMTWGFDLSYSPNARNPEWFEPVRDYLFWIDRGAETRVNYNVQLAANTASTLATKAGLTVRPHAGYLALGTRLALKEEIGPRSHRMNLIDAAVGVIGPASGARTIHDGLHGIIDNKSDDWNEIESEPFVNIVYEHGARFFAWQRDGRENLEIYPHVGVALGNVLTYGSLGLTMRVGRHLFKDLGAPRLRTMLTGTNFPESVGNTWFWNFFIGLEGRAVAYNALLDGNLLQDSLNVDSRPFIYEVQAGIEAGWAAYRLTAMNVYRSREFSGQQYTTEFIRVALAAEF